MLEQHRLAANDAAKPPSTPRAAEDELSSLAGAVREGAAAASNLVELIRSHRVGPKQLAEALPSCLEVATPRVLERLATELEAVVGRRLTELTVLLERAAEGHRRLAVAPALRARRLGARERLELEAVAGELARDLSALSCAAELLGAASAPRRVAVELGELFGSAAASSLQDGARTSALQSDPRVAVAMIEFARGLASEASSPAAGLDPDGRLRVSFERGARPVDGVTGSVVTAAAAVLGHRVEVGEERVDLVF